MAATRLIAIHHLKGKSILQCLRDRINYSQNPEKTKQGETVSYYQCTKEAAAEEFALSKREYEHITGRKEKGGVIAYMIRQSFKPGEITAEEANQIGYELAMRFTKGKHAFFVATHTDKAHIHNHIFFNSTTLDCRKKFKNFYLSGLAVQRLSDLLCIENHLSVIPHKKYSERKKENPYPKTQSKRDRIREDLDAILGQNFQNIPQLIQALTESGYEIKQGKNISVRKIGDEGRFVRFDTLGEDYLQLESLMLYGMKKQPPKKKSARKKTESREVNLLIDVQEKIQEGKGGGYTHWAKVFNVKQMARTILYLQEHDYESLEQLEDHVKAKVRENSIAAEKLKKIDTTIEEAKEMRKQIITYAQTREIYVAYRKSGYSKKYLQEHEEEIRRHKEAKESFNNYKQIPKVKELNKQIAEAYEERKGIAKEYYQTKKEMRELLTVRENVKAALKSQEKEKTEKNEKNL